MFKSVIASNNMVKSSVQKINLVCSIIRRQKALEAVLQLQFCKKSVSKSILKILKSAISNAKNNYNYNLDNMYIKSIFVGKSVSLKRSVARARGKANRIIKVYSRVLIILENKN